MVYEVFNWWVDRGCEPDVVTMGHYLAATLTVNTYELMGIAAQKRSRRRGENPRDHTGG